MDQSLMKDILYEFEKSNSHTSDLFRLQSDLSHAESELIALQIRFVHKTKENEELKSQLEHKTKMFNENKADYDFKSERSHSFEYHYNELLSKHKLCLECMSKQRVDNDILKERFEFLNNELNKMEKDKIQLQSLFKDQIEDMDFTLQNLIKENEDNNRIIKELRTNTQFKEQELHKHKELNAALDKKCAQLEQELEVFRDEYDLNIGDKCKKINLNEDSIKMLELELARLTSKLDQTNFELNDIKTNYLNQVKITDHLQHTTQQKDQMLKEFKHNQEKLLAENENLIKINLNLESDLNHLIKEFTATTEQERHDSTKKQKNYEILTKKLTLLYNNQQKKLESLVQIFKSQQSTTKTLKTQITQFSTKFKHLKSKLNNLKQLNEEKSHQIKNLQEKCFDLETKYSEKCEHLNNLEREIYLTRNSLEAAVNDMTNFQNGIRSKNDELIAKNQKIDHLESIINQQSNELNRRKVEINERIIQIESLDLNLKEEKSKQDLKIAHLEANLKSKSKQLHQRIDQIKDMNEIVDTLKEDKEQIEFKLQKYENLIKCQKLEIESKSSLLKQYELRIQDTSNELNNIKAQLNEDESTKLNDTSFMQKIYDIKETQTVHCFENVSTQVETITTGLIDDLKMNLKIKENLIESINDSLVLKDAEIARLKTRIGLFEREKTSD